MAKLNNKKILKTVSVIALATVFAQQSNAFFYPFAEVESKRETYTTPSGVQAPIPEKSWIEDATTFHEELKPKYNPVTQRVERPVGKVYTGGQLNEQTSTVKPAWYDKATTYNEEQRRPWNPYDLKEKEIPAYMYYDKDEAAAWNAHYQRDDLKPVPYMYGSASLVLRKERQPAELIRENMNLDGIRQIGKDPLDSVNQDARVVGAGNVYIRPAEGFDNIDRRYAHNKVNQHRDGFISLSDPIVNGQDVKNYNNVMIGNPVKSDVQAVTQIDKPVTTWRDKLDTKPIMTRPGDFDYKEEKQPVKAYVEQLQAANPGYYGEGQVIAGSGSAGNGGAFYQAAENVDYGNPYANNPYADSMVAKVNNYTVENGDTLSEISEKEKIYGDWTLWPLIYDANRQQVKDPDLINPGQNLDIPREYGQEEETDARYRARNREHPISLYDGK